MQLDRTAIEEDSHSAAKRAAALLDNARERTLLLVRAVSEEDLRLQHDPLMGPMIWDLGHIAHFEELWLTRNVDGPIEFGEMPGTYNPFEHPRRTRGELEFPSVEEMLADLSEVRARVLMRLEHADLSNDAGPLLRDGYVYAMVAQHEDQHGETMLQTLQLKQGDPFTPPVRRSAPPPSINIADGEMVRFPGGTVTIGTHDRSTAYDNERPQHAVALRPFLIDRGPVTNGAFLAFMNDGGYTRRALWSDEGWAWLAESGENAPKYWWVEHGVWHARSMDQSGPVDPRRPVCHVSFYEAEAFARWAGKRLPDEREWEAAATWNPETASAQAYPWGDQAPDESLANVDQMLFGTAPVGSYRHNVSPIGCYGMIGDVWEWTTSSFAPYPGYETFPYPEYSEVFFGDEYRVLRGGSWATRPGVARTTFRNWDYPIRRQTFSGFRCVRDE